MCSEQKTLYKTGMNKWYKIALKEATKSKRPRYKMGAAIIKSGRVLSASCNGQKTGRHAEIRAISKDIDFKGSTMYIARHGGEGISRPCRACFMLLRSVGIKKIVFKEGVNVITKIVSDEIIDDYRNYFL